MMAKWQAVQLANKQQQQVARQAHMQISIKEIEGRPRHQDNEEDECMQFFKA